jgi:molybdenum cofactor cytidylyltransferase
MRFGPVPLAEAEGAILAHSEVAGALRLRKGLVLSASDLAALAKAGYSEVTVARIEPGDVTEDAAAERLALALVPNELAAGLARSEAFTGRVNLKASRPGLFDLDVAAIHALNRLDPAITLATLPPLTRVAPGALCGTVKIITYGVAGAALAQAEALAARALQVRPVTLRTAGLLMTDVPGQEEKLVAKGRRAIETRLVALGMRLSACETTPHDEGAMAAALARMPGDMLLILTGSATSDLHDTAPQALRRAGGQVARFGMPVDPGNLLFHGALQGRPVIGLPGCARSPALNGADWVLERMACGLALDDDEIAAMGVGGLLKEIPSRPQPRERDV